MVAIPSAAVSLMTSTGKWLVSSHSAACGAMRSLAKVSAVSWMAACSSVSAKCMGSGPIGKVDDVRFVLGARHAIDKARIGGHKPGRSTFRQGEIEAIIGAMLDLARQDQSGIGELFHGHDLIDQSWQRRQRGSRLIDRDISDANVLA